MLFRTVTDLNLEQDLVRRRRYGVIEMVDGRLKGVHFRPYPKRVSLPELWWQAHWIHGRSRGDRCFLYFNQPQRRPTFLAAPYAVSHRDAKLATIRGALQTLGEIARIKHVDAMVCEVSSRRISERLLNRWGWERHSPHLRGRHFIRRFKNGDYAWPEQPVLVSQTNAAEPALLV